MAEELFSVGGARRTVPGLTGLYQQQQQQQQSLYPHDTVLSLVMVSSPFRGEVGACHTTDSCPSHSQLYRPMPRGQHTSVEHRRPYPKQCLSCLAFRFTCLAFVYRHEHIACMQTIWPVSDQISEQCVTIKLCF